MADGEQLITALARVELHHWRPLSIRSVVCDSRQVQAGDLFVAIPGVAVDGHDFVPQALAAGAVAIVAERLVPELCGIPTAIVPDAREALAFLHAAWNGFPARKLRVIGVTGTDGKTTTTRLITAILRAAGHAVGSIDTVSAEIGGAQLDTGYHTTTPDAPAMQTYLRQMVEAGMEYAVLETTSHGLAQRRVDACEYDVAVVTNITHDHLDYHGTYAAYRDAKALLFRHLGTSARKPDVPKVSVLNADDSSYEYLRAIPSEVQLSYGVRAPADVGASSVSCSPEGIRCIVEGPGARFEVTSPLMGAFNVPNILAACAVALSQGIATEHVARGIAVVEGVPGRMERVAQGQPFTVIVDFAHTPNALDKALQSLRGMTHGMLVVVFGCAGLRDRAKRPLMGEVACRLADRVIITAEDPRTEPLDAIMEEVAAGCRRAGGVEGRTFWRVGDRGEAIAMALHMAAPGDLADITGKGHEQSMCFGSVERPWDDREAARAVLAHMGYPQ